MMFSEQPHAPVRVLPDNRWEHAEIYTRVREAIAALPAYFRSQTVIEGISAVDIFTLNSALGATIENQVVASLNQMRPLWDPEDRYQQYAFVRQSQTFPDVLLKSMSDEDIVLGIEMKGWYLLAKEGEPSFRFKATPMACAPADLIVVVPWALSNVVSGSPVIFAPYVESARYAAEYRNHHWVHVRDAKDGSGIEPPASPVTPYPKKQDLISDVAQSDKGGNFGRFSRTGIMDTYLAKAKSQYLGGIRADHWLAFFKLFQDQRGNEIISAEIANLRKKLDETESVCDTKIEAALAILENLETLVTE